jgi:hypothetical protein
MTHWLFLWCTLLLLLLLPLLSPLMPETPEGGYEIPAVIQNLIDNAAPAD